MHRDFPAGATVPCIKISVLCHHGTQILIQYLGLFFCIFLEIAMQKSKDYPLELVFGEGELQDFVSMNQMFNLLPNE